MTIDKGEVIQAEDICNMFNKITTKTFLNPEKEMPVLVQGVFRTASRQIRGEPLHILALSKQSI